jgi:hypothetical protein
MSLQMAYNRFRGTESRGVAIAQHSVTGSNLLNLESWFLRLSGFLGAACPYLEYDGENE